MLVAASLIVGAMGTAFSVPVTAGAKTHGPGIISHGTFHPCSKPDPKQELAFDFAGLMPAGKRVHQIASGHAEGTAWCGDPVAVAVTGVNMAGKSLQWACSGPVKFVHAGLPVEEVLLTLSEWAFVPPALKATRAGPIFLYDAACSTVDRPDKFRLRALLMTIQDLNPDPMSGTFEVAGGYVASAS